MRVGVIVDPLLGRVPGGSGRYARELTTALAATQTDGDTLTGWVGAHRDVTAAMITGVRGPRRIPLPTPVLNRLAPRGLAPGPRGADVVLAPTAFAIPQRGRPLVASVFDTVPFTDPDTMSPRSRDWHRAMTIYVAERAAALLLLTQAVADDLPRRVPGLDPAKLRVTGAGASAAVTTLPPDAAARARALALPPAYTLVVGTLEPRKGLDVALAALTRPADPGLPLLIVGPPGWGGTDPVTEARRLGIDPARVRVLGPLPDDDVAVCLARASAVLVPSRSEGFGLPVVEAMAHGTPVVISDAAALVEVADGVAEVAPVGDADALAAAVARAVDPSTRERRGSAGREVAARHTWAAVARRTWDVLREVHAPTR